MSLVWSFLHDQARRNAYELKNHPTVPTQTSTMLLPTLFDADVWQRQEIKHFAMNRLGLEKPTTIIFVKRSIFYALNQKNKPDALNQKNKLKQQTIHPQPRNAN